MDLGHQIIIGSIGVFGTKHGESIPQHLFNLPDECCELEIDQDYEYCCKDETILTLMPTSYHINLTVFFYLLSSFYKEKCKQFFQILVNKKNWDNFYLVFSNKIFYAKTFTITRKDPVKEIIEFFDISVFETENQVAINENERLKAILNYEEKMKERRNRVHIIDIDGLNKYIFAKIKAIDTNLNLGYVQVPLELADKLTVNTKFTINSTILYDTTYLQKGIYPIVSVPGQEPGNSLNGTICQVTSIQEVPPTYEDVIKLTTFYTSWHILNDITVIEEKKEKPILADERFYFIEVIIDFSGGEKNHQLFEVPYHKYFDLVRGQTLMINDTERYYTNDGERHWLQRASNYNPHFGYKIVNKYDFDTLKDAYKKIKEINGEDTFEEIKYSFWHYILKYKLYDGDKFINEVYDVSEDKWETMVRNTPVTSSASIEINKETSERERVEIQAFKKRFEELRDKVENSRRKNSMNNIFKNINFQFGEVKTDQIKYSFNGIAFKNVDGTYSTYDINTNTLTNVSDLIMDIPMYVMPAAIKDIKIGDIVIHKGIVYVIKEVKEEGFTAIQPNTGTMATLIPEKSIFGFDYMSRVMNIFAFSQASAENPFGNMLPFFVMNKESNDNTLALMMMMQGNQDFDKLLPFMLMGKENINPMTMMMLMNFNK